MIILKKLGNKLIKIDYVKNAIEEKADLSAFQEKPTPRVIFGLFLMGLSYILGWPAVSFFGILSIIWKEPLIIIIGGPVIYGISHLVFLAGLYLAGVKYSIIFSKWATRMAVEKMLNSNNDESSDIELLK